jgi:DNA-binding NarL/FixJ family response regulator
MTEKQTRQTNRPRTKVLIVEDHPVFRDGLVQLLGREADLMVCGQADTAPQALKAVSTLKPDLVLVDLGLPGKSGLELVKDLRVMQPDLPVLVISMHDESLYADRILRAGAHGYIMKQERPDEIVVAIRQVLRGQIYLSGKMSGRMLDAFSGRRPKMDNSRVAALTDRELEILQWIGRGKSSHEIAEGLHLSPKTVDTHRAHIKQKLMLKSAMELTCFAARWTETGTPSPV